MSDEPTFKLTESLIVKVVIGVMSALLGTNLYSGVTSQRELTREQARWDSETAALIIKKLERIEARLNERP